MEWFGGGRELSEWSSNGTIISNEATVEMSKSEELLKFLAGRGGLPLGNGCDLGGIRANAASFKNVPEEWDAGGVKLTLFSLNVQLIFG